MGSKAGDKGHGFAVEQKGTGQVVKFDNYDDASRRNTQVNGLFAEDPTPRDGTNDGAVQGRR